ncbi:RDD family protein [Oryzobacter sp. R7]|uniref:RDD family protein n=1 Tax=Oryzobacter faecalis TaxID=3388656 RepID=UPI00398C8389
MSDPGGYRSYAGDDLVTGEGVAVEVPAASVAARMASGLIDVVLALTLLIGGIIAFGLALGDASDAMVGIVGIAWSTIVIVVLPATLETVTRGRTLGKLALGLRVVRDDGGPITARHAVVRALVAYVEVYILTGVPALLAAMIHPRGKRLGDMAAGTMVVSQRARLRLTAPPMVHPSLQQWAAGADVAALPSGLTVAVRQFLSRAPSLSPESRHRLGVELLHTTLPHVSPPPPAGHHPEVVLAAVVAERRRRDLERLWREERLRARVLPSDPLLPRG